MKILVVRLGSLGDLVHTIPAQQLLRRIYPRAVIHWLTEPRYVPFLDCVEGVSRVWSADTKSWRRQPYRSGLLELVRSLRAERFDLAFDFQGLLKSAVLARLSGADEVVGFPAAQLREPLAALFYTRTRRAASLHRHQVDHHLDLVDPPLHRARFSAYPIPLELPPEVSSRMEQQLDGLASRPLLLNPGGGWITKRWPAERFGRLAKAIEDRWGLPVILTYGPGEEPLLAEAAAGCGRPLRSFPTSILELAALGRLARLMVAGDTGPLHLTESVGTPVVGLLGPALPWRTGPYSPQNPVVLHDRQCPHPYRRQCRDHFCMDYPMEKVLQAVELRLGLR